MSSLSQNNKSILIIDDDSLISEMIQSLLKEKGHDISYCDNIVDAIKLSKEQNFNLILIDYNMPRLSGDVICRLIRHYRPSSFIVGFSSVPRRNEFISAGADKFIDKSELSADFSIVHQLVQQTP